MCSDSTRWCLTTAGAPDASHPSFEGLPCVLETPGPNHSGPSAEELALARALRARGIAARRATTKRLAASR